MGRKSSADKEPSPDPASAELRFIGVAGAKGMGDGTIALPQRQAWSALAYLVVNQGRPVQHDELADALWGDALPKTWEPALRVVVKKVRDFLTELGLEGSIVRTAYGGYQLDVPDRLVVDVIRVRHAFADADESFREGRFADVLMRASHLRSSTGEFLPGEHASWIEAERADLRGIRLRALAIVSRAARAIGDPAEAVAAAREAVNGDPLNETAHRLLIETHDAVGDRAQALEAYERCRATLADELGVDPSAETQDLYLRVLRAEGPTDGSGRPPFPGPLDGGGPFVGRGDELDRLEQELRTARDGLLRLVVVHGEPGIGKTRLMSEFGRRAYDDGSTVLYGRCDEDAIGPYQPFVEALSRIGAGTLESAIPPELAQLVPGLTASAGEPLSTDPNTLRYRLFESIGNVIAGAVTSEAGLVLVIDDLHWAERPTLLLLEHIVRTRSRAPILIVGSHRSDEPSDALAETLANMRRTQELTDISLVGLSIDEMGALVETWDDTLTGALGRAMRERTDGNPFFAIEILRHLREGEEAIALEAPEDIGAGIPSGIRAVIRRRLNRLSGDAQEVLVLAGVIGRHFDLALLESLVEADIDVPRTLEEAAGAELVAEVSDALGQYRFAHHLVRTVLYDDLSATRRARMHQRVGLALEELAGDDPLPRVSELAHHFASAGPVGDTARGARYLELAGDRALELLAFEDAVGHYTKALSLVPATDHLVRARLLIALAEAQGRSADGKSACFTLFDAVPHADEAGLLPEVADTLVRVTSFLATNWDEELWDAAQSALDVLPDGDSSLRAVLLSRTALVVQAFGVPPEMLKLAAPLSIEAFEMASRLDDPTARAATIQARILCDPSPDLFDERLDLLRELASLSTATGDDPLRMNTQMWLGMEALARGDAASSQTSMHEFERIGEAIGHPWTGWRVMASESNRAIMRGEFDVADELIQRALQLGVQVGVPQGMLFYASQLFQLRREEGRLLEVQDALIAFAKDVPALQGPLALFHSEVGHADEARELLAREVEQIEADPFPHPGMFLDLTYLAFACDAVDDRRHAATLLARLAPHTGRHIVLAGLAGYWGPTDLALGGLAATLGRDAEAEGYLVRALEMCDDAEVPAWKARTQVRLGQMLSGRDEVTARGLHAEAGATAARLGMSGLTAKIAASGLVEP